MSANELLELLRDFEVEHQYPCLYGNGITSLDQLEQLDTNKLRALGISGRDDVGQLVELITALRDERKASEAAYNEASRAARRTAPPPPPSSEESRGRYTLSGGFVDSDDDTQFGVSAREVGAPRVGGAVSRRPSSLYKHSNGSGSGIPRANTNSSFSPPMPAMTEARTIGRHAAQQQLPPPGKAALGRRQSLAPPSSSSAGRSHTSDNAQAAAPSSSGPGQGVHRSRTVAARQGAGGGRPRVSNVSEILEHSRAVAQAQRNMEDSDDDLERVVRKTGQSGLVNAYGIPVRPTTAHGAKRSASDRRSLAPSGARPTTSRGGGRGESSFGLAPREKTPPSNLHDKIRVCVRKRPLSTKEKERGDKDIVMATGARSLSVMEPKVKVDLTKYIEESRFVFDEVFSENATNTQVYERTAKPLVEYIFGGGNATCFAYGQTGSGKTYTMLDALNGLYIQAADDLFAMAARPEYSHLKVHVSFYEIYLTNLFDLLANRAKLNAREDANQNVCIQGLREVLVQSSDDLLSVFEYGNNCRSTGSTGANSDSSRSHAILQISLRDNTSQRGSVVRGKLSFIDLAGNERGADRGDRADKQTMMEGAEINKSLLALKECIRALDLNKKHQPFRQSKLTQVLKDSFLGNSRACMIATISPNTSNSDNTLNTLRYADRVKAMKNTNGPASASSVGESAAPADSDEYYAGNVDPSYEDDSGDRAYDDTAADSGYDWRTNSGGYHPNAQDVLREEDEYADDMDDAFDPVVNTSHHHQPRVTQMRRPSLEERLELEISSAHVPSIMDEQPLFLDEAPPPAAAAALRSPRSYGSPAAKSFVASRHIKPPAASKLNGLLLRGTGRHVHEEESEEPEDGLPAAAAEPPANTYRLTRSHARRMAEQPPAFVPHMPRSSSMDMMNASALSPPPVEGRTFIRTANTTRARASTQSSGTEHQRRDASPYTSAVSLPSSSNSPKEDDDEDPVQGVELLAAPLGGLRVAEVDYLVKLHRAEIRATTETCKEETMLISAYSSFNYAQLAQQSRTRTLDTRSMALSSWQNQSLGHAGKYHLDVNSGAVTRLSDGVVFESVDVAKIQEGREYLERLDEVLARKQQLIVDLRTEIRKLV
ncbi:hypothetical protein H4R27_005490 [Coemansia aciculifera]|nr:hypothetical protein GGH93_004057 [Coemansia aciculifera]KAJ2879104.1 hypothetical protein H4R27_005490 [Coemansia aciculifera]